jgi:hypothetical protein
MPGPGSCAGPDLQLVRLASGDNLVHERVNRRAAAVDDALSADLENRGVRKDPKVRRSPQRSEPFRTFVEWALPQRTNKPAYIAPTDRPAGSTATNPTFALSTHRRWLWPFRPRYIILHITINQDRPSLAAA